MTFKFNYTLAGPFKFPLVDIRISSSGSKESLKYTALVDSGAVFCVFHSEIAELLDINLTAIKEKVVFKGVGKAKRELKGKVAAVEIMLAQKGKSYKFDTPVVFSDDIDKDGYPLLGMRGFFDKFKDVTFSEERGKVILKTGK